MLGRIALLLAFSIFCASAQRQNDVIRGQLTTHSVQIYEGRVSGVRDFEWQGSNSISRFEVRTEGNANPHLESINFRGGIAEDYLQFWSDRQELNVLVRVFSEPRNHTMGWRSPTHVLVNSTRITGETPLNVNITGAFNVGYAELTDLTNGTGVRVDSSRLHQSSLQLRFRSQMFRARVDFLVNVYGVRVTPNHHEIGNLTAQSVLISSQTITTNDLTQWGAFSLALPNHNFQFARLTDLTDGTGGRVIGSSHFQQTLNINFENRPNLRFLLEVFGTSRRQAAETNGTRW